MKMWPTDRTSGVLQAIFCTSGVIDTVLAFGVQNYLDFKLFQGRSAIPCLTQHMAHLA